MRKTLLALIVGASVFAVPAFAQVNLGGAAQVGAHAGAGMPIGTPVQNTMGMAGQMGSRAGDNARGMGQHARHATRNTVNRTASAARRTTDADANANASAQAGDSNAHAGAGLSTGSAAGAAGDAGQGVGGDVRDASHSAIQSTDRSAGSVGDAAKNAADKKAVGADADVKAKGGMYGH